LGLVCECFALVKKIVSEMTRNVSSGALNVTELSENVTKFTNNAAEFVHATWSVYKSFEIHVAPEVFCRLFQCTRCTEVVV